MRSFDDDLIASLTDDEVALKCLFSKFPDTIKRQIDPVPKKTQKATGGDYFLHGMNGITYIAEFKGRDRNRYQPFGDISIEIEKNTNTHEDGWIFTLDADLLVYYFIGKNDHVLGDIYLLNFKKLQDWYREVGCHSGYRQPPPGTTYGNDGVVLYHTINVVVPWSDLPEGIVIKTIKSA